MQLLRHLWQRHVTGTPDRYRAYVSFPTDSGGPSVAEVHDRIGELERVFEGRLDVYARLKGVSVVTDPVPARRFDADAFESVLERIEADYAETHRLAHLEKWLPLDGGLVKSVVAVPVRPLFPQSRPDRRRVRVPTE